jgi:hypothetical protein
MVGHGRPGWVRLWVSGRACQFGYKAVVGRATSLTRDLFERELLEA